MVLDARTWTALLTLLLLQCLRWGKKQLSLFKFQEVLTRAVAADCTPDLCLQLQLGLSWYDQDLQQVHLKPLL